MMKMIHVNTVGCFDDDTNYVSSSSTPYHYHNTLLFKMRDPIRIALNIFDEHVFIDWTFIMFIFHHFLSCFHAISRLSMEQ